MKKNSFLFFSLATAATSLTSCVGEQESLSRVSIQGGTPDGSAPAIAQIEVMAGDELGFCTGAWIAPNALLTADHCVRGNKEIVFFPEGGSDDGIPQYGRAELVGVRKRQCVGVPLASIEDCLAKNYYDVAVVVFAKNLAPATLPLMEIPPDAGSSFSILGYGATRCSAVTERVLWSGRKPGRLNVRLETPSANGAVTRYAAFTSDSPSLPCSGDSGGPFIDSKTGGVFAVTGLVAEMADKTKRLYGTTLQAVMSELQDTIQRNNLAVRFVANTANTANPASTPVARPTVRPRGLSLTSFSTAGGGEIEVFLQPSAGSVAGGWIEIFLAKGALPERYRVLQEKGGAWVLAAEGFFNLTSKSAFVDLVKIGSRPATLKIEVISDDKITSSEKFELRRSQ